MRFDAAAGSPNPQPAAFAHRSDPDAYAFSVRRVTRDDAAWIEMGRLRARTYVDEYRYLPPDVVDEHGAEFDAFDEVSSHIACLAPDGRVIACVRIVRRSREHPLLPAEELFETRLPEDAVEISRHIVDSRVPRRVSTLVSLALMRATTEETLAAGECTYEVIERGFRTYLETRIGIGLETVAEARTLAEYRGTVNELVRIRPSRVVASVHAHDRIARPSFLPTHLAPFMAQPAFGEVVLGRDTKTPSAQFSVNERVFGAAQRAAIGGRLVSLLGGCGELAVALARLGVTRFRLAEPGRVGIADVGSEESATFAVIGMDRAAAVAARIAEVNPNAEVEIVPTGAAGPEPAAILDDASLVVLAGRGGGLRRAVPLARAAREREIPLLVIQADGLGAHLTSVLPTGMDLERLLGADGRGGAPDPSAAPHRWRIAPHAPSYPLSETSGPAAAQPALVVGEKLAAAAGAIQAVAHLLAAAGQGGSATIRVAPRILYVDAVDGTGTVRFRRLHHWRCVLARAVRTRFGRPAVFGAPLG